MTRALVAASAVAGACVLAVAVTVSASGSLSNVFIEVGGASGMCLTKKDAGWANGNALQVGRCDGDVQGQKWTYNASTLQIQSAYNPSKCIARKYGNADAGNPIHLWDCSGGASNLQWLYNWQSGRISIAASPTMCLAKKYSHAAIGNPIQLEACDGAHKNLEWHIQSSASPPVEPVPSATGAVFYVQCPEQEMEAKISTSPWGINAGVLKLPLIPNAVQAGLSWPDQKMWIITCYYGKDSLQFPITMKYQANSCEYYQPGRVKCSG